MYNINYGFFCISFESEVQDIDNEEDWVLAEMKYQHLITNIRNNV